jgi:hypothetical protein
MPNRGHFNLPKPRNPAAKAWERWTRDATLRTLDTHEGPVEFWHETAWVSLPLVAYDTFTRNLRTGEEESNRDVLAFRDVASLIGSLEKTGFSRLAPVRRLAKAATARRSARDHLHRSAGLAGGRVAGIFISRV